MRKNKSVKEYSLGKNRRSQGKQISIELDGWARQGSTHRGSKQTLQNSQMSDRIDRSVNPISQNILKDIINYSHISQSHLRNNKNNTLASYERHQDVFSQFSKINKKASLGDVRRDSNKLVIEQKTPSNSIPSSAISSQFFNDNRSIQMTQSVFCPQARQQSHVVKDNSSRKNSLNNSISKGQLLSIEKERSQLAAKLDQLHSIEEEIMRQYPQMISQWEQMINIEQNNSNLTKKLAQIQIRRDTLKSEIDSSSSILFTVSKELVTCRRSWQTKSNGARSRVLDEAMYSHNQFLRKLTVRAFEQTLVFNMKVTIPDYKGKGSIRGIYDELFHSRLTKKFVMLLKKYRNQMDLYDGELLNDFTKKIVQFESQYNRCEGESFQLPDQSIINRMELIVNNIDQMKQQLQQTEDNRNIILKDLDKWQKLQENCEKNISQLIQEINSMVKGDYEKQTQKAADFRTLLAQKYTAKYRQFKGIRASRQKAAEQLHRVQGLLGRF